MPQPLRGRHSGAAKVLSKRNQRGSATERGYDHRWRAVSAKHRRLFPFCIWCRQVGRLEFAKLVDHKIPVVDGGPMFDPDNRWGLCVMHHGVKGEMERFARQSGQLERLPLWCDDPAERPPQFR